MSTNTKPVQFPADIFALRGVVKRAIEQFQGSPVKNMNKLNEAIAHALDFNNYDQLAAALKASDSVNLMVSTYPISFDYGDKSSQHQYIIINGVRINNDLACSSVVDYTVEDREECISNLTQFISEATSRSTKQAMMSDLAYLMTSKAEWVLSNTSNSNFFIAPDIDPERFQTACDEILAKAADYYAEQVGVASKTGLFFPDAVHEWLGDAHPVYAGQLVLIPRASLQDDTTPVGMDVKPFTEVGMIPEDYIPAYAVDGFYVPLDLRA